jgi:hypothetical protein
VEERHIIKESKQGKKIVGMFPEAKRTNSNVSFIKLFKSAMKNEGIETVI